MNPQHLLAALTQQRNAALDHAALLEAKNLVLDERLGAAQREIESLRIQLAEQTKPGEPTNA